VTAPRPTPPPALKVVIAFAAIYLIWGSTYLAIRFAIETLPPFSMAAVRFIVAGGILYAIARPRTERPTGLNWFSAGVVGTPARVSTYAYVNPAVAVLLGWLLANERFDARAALAVVIILSAVVLVSVKGRDARRPGGLSQSYPSSESGSS